MFSLNAQERDELNESNFCRNVIVIVMPVFMRVLMEILLQNHHSLIYLLPAKKN